MNLEKSRSIHLESVCRKTIVKRCVRKVSKSAKRKNRRKRSRRMYMNMLNMQRVSRTTEDLCNSIQEVSVVDVDMTPMGALNQLPPEVAEWHNKEQLAYWKSRAISLEIENKMLRTHIRNVYAQTIEQYQPNSNIQQVEPSKIEPTKSQPQQAVVLPNEPPGKHRLKEMEKIYGSSAQKIMGMETALELNYEHLVEDGTPNYWPNLPLKL